MTSRVGASMPAIMESASFLARIWAASSRLLAGIGVIFGKSFRAFWMLGLFNSGKTIFMQLL